MKLLKIINVLALLFIFTPFFQMCSDNSFGTKREASVSADSVAIADTIAGALADSNSLEAMQLDTLATKLPDIVKAEPSMLSKFWDLITVPGENMTLTGFGLFVRLIVQVAEGAFNMIWIGEILVSISVLLSIYSSVRILRNKSKGLALTYTFNFLILTGVFILAFLTFEKFSQIKWGFYVYSFLIFVLMVQSFLVRRRSIS